MKVLGLDPGPRHCGIALIEAGRGLDPQLIRADTIDSDASGSLRDQERVNRIMDEIRAEWLNPLPDLIAMEEFSWQGHPITCEAHVAYRLVGAMGDRLRDYAPIVPLTAREWREQLLGVRCAKKYTAAGESIKSALKRQVEIAVCLRLSITRAEIEIRGSQIRHAIDALGVAIMAADRQIMARAALTTLAEMGSRWRAGRKK